jgi:glycosyltransferase involved in cell wall biosynthesis
MKRVLIITYYWPPSGGGGVMRWLKMSKYLPENGWQPVVYTPENPDPSVRDESLLREVHPDVELVRTPIWEPYDLYRMLTGKKKSAEFKAGYISEASRGNWKERLSVFLRGNLLIPDPRVFWVRPSVKFLKKYLKENPVDLMVTTGPPHSMHLIGARLKEYFPEIPWLADFRDPWTEIDFYHRLKLTTLADTIHRRMEKKILRSADVVTTVSPYLKRTTEQIAGRRVEVIHNGFDPADFDFTIEPDYSHFTLSHFGAFNRDRNPSALWKALGMLKNEYPGFGAKLRIQLIGQTDDTILRDLENEGLGEYTVLTGHMKHREGLRLLAESQMLLLPLNDAPNVRGILPGKMYEYMALRRPVLAIGPPDADFADIIRETRTGYVQGFDAVDGIKTDILKAWSEFNKGKLEVSPEGYEKFSRKSLARKIMQLPFPGGH